MSMVIALSLLSEVAPATLRSRARMGLRSHRRGKRISRSRALLLLSFRFRWHAALLPPYFCGDVRHCLTQPRVCRIAVVGDMPDQGGGRFRQLDRRRAQAEPECPGEEVGEAPMHGRDNRG